MTYSGMRGTCWIGVAALIAGCVSAHRTPVRDLDGNPVPLYSPAAHGPVERVRCTDGRDYLVVTTPPPPFLLGAGVGSVLRRSSGLGDVCGRIVANRR